MRYLGQALRRLNDHAPQSRIVPRVKGPVLRMRWADGTFLWCTPGTPPRPNQKQCSLLLGVGFGRRRLSFRDVAAALQ